MAATPARLWTALACLLLATAAAWTVAFVSVSGARQTVQTARDETVPALTGARQAHAALIDADRTVARSFLSGDVGLGGPGERYQDDIKAASQAIQQLGGPAATAADRQNLRTVDALLVTYTGTVEQADAGHRAELAGRPTGLGQAYLLYASELLHERDPDAPASSGALARLDAVGTEQATALDGAQRTWWLGGGALGLTLAAGLALLAVLGGVQVWAARRFRRVLNPALLGATLAAATMLVWSVAALVQVQDGYAAARSEGLTPLLANWQTRAGAADLDGQAALAAVLGRDCRGAPCAATAERLARAAGETAGPRATSGTLAALGEIRAGNAGAAAETLVVAERQFNAEDAAAARRAAASGQVLDDRLRAASALPGLGPGLGLLAGLTALGIGLGLRPRLAEYRS